MTGPFGPSSPVPSGPPTLDSAPPVTTGTTGYSPVSATGGTRRGGVGKWFAGLALVVAGLGALVISQDPTDRVADLGLQSRAEPTAATPSAPPTTVAPSTVAPSTAPDATVDDEGQTGVVSVEGTILPLMPGVAGPTSPAVDAAIGQIAPTLMGTDFDGNEITIGPDGRMKAVFFLAHWCPHCQVEVPTIQGLIDAGAQPAGLDIYGISTAVSPERGNYPPLAWLNAEGWSSALMRDDAEASALISYGAGGFPFVVYLDGENRVLTRAAGEMPAPLMQQVWELVAAGG